MLYAALPWQLMLFFVVFPMVSSSAFRAFSCEDFGNGQSFLRADYSIECDTEAYARVEQLAWLGILLYPVGISVLCEWQPHSNILADSFEHETICKLPDPTFASRVLCQTLCSFLRLAAPSLTSVPPP